MYHPSRGGVRGGRDQFKWDDVKVDKHRENYLGHSIKAPVGRWQKGKDLHWYTRDKKSLSSEMELAKEEIRKIKEEEEQAMREALGLAPKRSTRPQGNRLDKHEFSELIKRGSTAEDLGAGHAEAARVQGLGYSRAPGSWEESTSLPLEPKDVSPMGENKALPSPPNPTTRSTKEEEPASEDERSRKKRRREERKHEKRDKHSSHDSDDKRKHRREKEKRRRDSD
ncbi:multiple myeloma tumor-associated protein 2 homolog [Macadamia integrifolia]|uniref:multiple myeloma tumor-associated protein 2 homolog n=1 Tax=Macadamia integrifolia TaxID=60698 RepID=UPI001C4F109D|nr:multiple myeloma tumor-associated protein 2 homolog [Macadamia integrifolia]